MVKDLFRFAPPATITLGGASLPRQREEWTDWLTPPADAGGSQRSYLAGNFRGML